jgi:hypothetical protein
MQIRTRNVIIYVNELSEQPVKKLVLFNARMGGRRMSVVVPAIVVPV